MSFDFTFIEIMDMIGTIAFALSGAAVAARKGMDIFGINILALVTATGGGVIRDVIVGMNPPLSFQNPIYLVASLVTANIAFIIMSLRKGKTEDHFVVVPERALFWFDTVGLAAFTVDGAIVGYNSQEIAHLFDSLSWRCYRCWRRRSKRYDGLRNALCIRKARIRFCVSSWRNHDGIAFDYGFDEQEHGDSCWFCSYNFD